MMEQWIPLLGAAVGIMFGSSFGLETGYPGLPKGISKCVLDERKK